MEKFIESEQYQKLKAKYDREYFKLNGKYCWYDGNRLTQYPSSEIAEYFKNKKISIKIQETSVTETGDTITKNKTVNKTFHQVWSEDVDMREYREVIFHYNKLQIKSHQFHLFPGFDHLDNIPTDNMDWKPMFEHMRSLVNYNESHFNYMLNWLAQLVQFPHILPHTTLIFISEEGVGKDLFGDFISNTINEKYCHNTEKLELLCGKFDTVLGGKLLMIVNETNPVESRERIENIKFLTTAKQVTIEGKHKDPVKCTNYCRFMFFSNRLFAFPIEEGSRRPVLFKSSDKYLKENIGAQKNKEYFTQLATIYSDVRYQKAFLKFLQSRDISNFAPNDFEKSELHKTLEENSVSPLVGFLAKIVQCHDKEKKYRLKTTEALKCFNDYMKELNSKFDFTQTKFNVQLESVYKIK